MGRGKGNAIYSQIYSPTPSSSHFPKQARKRKQHGKIPPWGSYQWRYDPTKHNEGFYLKLKEFPWHSEEMKDETSI